MEPLVLSPIDLFFADADAKPSNVAFGFPGRLDAGLVAQALDRACELYFPVRGRLVELDPTHLALGGFDQRPVLHVEEVGDEVFDPDAELDLADRVESVSATSGGPLVWFKLLQGARRSAILVSFSHVLGDAAAFFDFVMDWVALAAGRPALAPVFDRGAIRAIFEDVRLDPRRLDLRALTGGDRGFLAEGQRVTAERSAFIGIDREPYPREAVREAIAAAEQSTGRRPTVFSVVAGEVFRQTAAQNRAQGIGNDTAIVVPVDLRRILPALPKKYFGNALKAVSVTRRHEAVLDATVAERALWIDDAVRSVSFDGLSLDWHLLDFLRKMRGYRKVQALRVTQPHSVLVSDLSYAPVRFVHFGGVRCDRLSLLSLYARTVAVVDDDGGWSTVRARLRSPA